MTDNEIIKALECLAYWGECKHSSQCPYYMDNDIVSGCDNVTIAKEALDLINSLTAENGVYETCSARKDETIRHMEAKINRLEINLFSAKGEINSQKAEIERLQKILVGFMDEVGTWSNKSDVDISNIHKLPLLAKEDWNIRNKIKAEAIKEFAERLKKYIPNFDGDTTMECVYRATDNLVKEMTE